MAVTSLLVYAPKTHQGLINVITSCNLLNGWIPPMTGGWSFHLPHRKHAKILTLFAWFSSKLYSKPLLLFGKLFEVRQQGMKSANEKAEKNKSSQRISFFLFFLLSCISFTLKRFLIFDIYFLAPDVCNHLANKSNFSFGRYGCLYSADFVHLPRLGPPRLQQRLSNKRQDRAGFKVRQMCNDREFTMLHWPFPLPQVQWHLPAGESPLFHCLSSVGVSRL